MAGRGGLLLGALLIATGSSWSHAVQQIKSLYSAIDIKSCKIIQARPGGEARLCAGLPGYPVYIAETGGRAFVSVGANPGRTRAATQSPPGANSLFEDQSSRMTVEWRFVIRKGSPVPYATIVRYFTADSRGSEAVLVVMRVTPTEVCHVAYIDANATAQAIVLARRIADEKARDFDCASEPTREGAVSSSSH